MFSGGRRDQAYQTDDMNKMRSESLKAGFGLMKVADVLDKSSFKGVIGEKV